MADLTTRLFGITMPSPFILASGPLSYDATGLWEAYRAGAGGVTTKTLRLEAAINPTPHMVRAALLQPARHAVQHREVGRPAVGAVGGSGIAQR